MAVRFTENPEGLAAALASKDMQRALHVAMTHAEAYAEGISPVRTGRYISNFRVESGVRNGKAYARLINDTPYARFLEFGTRYMARQRILGRSIHAIRFP